MNPNLKPATDVDRVKTTVGFESPVEPFDTHATVINRLPLWSLGRPSHGFLVGWVGVYNWLRIILAFDGVAKGINAPGSQTKHGG